MVMDRNEKFERGLDDFLRGGRDFKIGDYAVDKFGNMFHATDKSEKEVLNANKEKWGFRQATESEIEEYHHEE